MKAIAFAAAAAIAVQPFVFFSLFIAPMLLGGQGTSVSDSLYSMSLAALFSMPLVIFIGIPSFLVLRRFKCLSLPSLAIVGSVAAALPIAVLGPSSDWPGYLLSVLFGGLHGLVGALAFLLVWRRAAFD